MGRLDGFRRERDMIDDHGEVWRNQLLGIVRARRLSEQSSARALAAAVIRGIYLIARLQI